MSGQMKKYNYSRYYESIKNMSEPIMPSQLPHVKCSISEIISYAHKREYNLINYRMMKRNHYFIHIEQD